MFFFAVGHIFLGIVNKMHPFDLNVIARTPWSAGEDSPRHCAMFPRATLSSDSILRSHQDNFSRGSSPSGIIYNIYNIYITLLTLYNIIDKIYNIYTASYCNSAVRHQPTITAAASATAAWTIAILYCTLYCSGTRPHADIFTISTNHNEHFWSFRCILFARQNT